MTEKLRTKCAQCGATITVGWEQTPREAHRLHDDRECALREDCPTCNAPRGEKCKSADGDRLPISRAHRSRL